MVAPIVYGAWVVGAWVVAELTGCDSPEQNSGSAGTGTTDTIDSIVHDAIPDTASAQDQAPPEPDQSGPTDSFDAGPDGAVNFASACPAFPLKGNFKLLGTIPCGGDYGFISDIDRIDDETGMGSCMDGATSTLFRISADGIGDIQEITYGADQLAQHDDVTHFTGFDANYAYGLGVFDPLNGNGVDWLGFSPEKLEGKTFTPSFSKGLLWHSGHLFVVTSNVNWATGSPVYDPGTVLVYPDDSSSLPDVLSTGGVNATGIGLATVNGQERIVVVNSGNYNSTNLSDKTSFSSLAMIDPESLQVLSTLPLDLRGLGIAGEISVAGALIALGSADNSGDVAIADLDTQDIRVVETAKNDSGSHFITVALLWPKGNHLITGDFNTGKLQQWDISSETFIEAGAQIPLDKKLDDAAGISDAVCMGGKLYVAVGKDIWVVE